MPINPALSLAVTPPQIQSPVESASHVLQLKSLMNQQTLQQQAMQENTLKLQEQQQQQADQAKLADAWKVSGGDLDTFMTHARMRGVAPQTILSIEEGVNKAVASAAQRGTATLGLETAKTKALQEHLDGFSRLPPDQQQSMWPAFVMAQVNDGFLSPQEAQQHSQWQGPETAKSYAALLLTQDQILARAKSKAETEKTTGEAAKLQAETAQLQAGGPLKPDQSYQTTAGKPVLVNGRGEFFDLNRTPLPGDKVQRVPPASVQALTTPIPDVTLSPQQKKIATDLATGDLTFAQFNRLYPSRGGAGAAIKQAIYSAAREENPNFNPAQFEMGFKFAENPKVRQQIASLKNVESGVADLLKFSEQASRSGVTVLNKFIVPGGVALGGKKYSNFKTARIAFADELSGALGYGSATDMSREMGFNMTDENLSPENFQAAIEEVILPFVARKKKTLYDQMGVYGPAGSTPPAPASDLIYARDPQGTLHSAKAGTKLPAGWKVEAKP